MPRDLGRASQSQSKDQENEKPQAAPTNSDQTSSSHKDDEDFVDIDHDDVDMQDTIHHEPSPDGLGLQRLSANSAGSDEDDDSDDEPDHMASHPLLSMLTGRMGQRRRGSNHKWDALHPVTQVLSPANVDDCTQLEEDTFPEHERCSREKVRLKCVSYMSPSTILAGCRLILPSVSVVMCSSESLPCVERSFRAITDRMSSSNIVSRDVLS